MESKELRERLSKNLKKYRKAKGWSQFELAEKAEISEQTVNSIEGLRLWPSDNTLLKISNALEVDMYNLFMPTFVSLPEDSINELKKTIARTMNDILSETVQDWVSLR